MKKVVFRNRAPFVRLKSYWNLPKAASRRIDRFLPRTIGGTLILLLGVVLVPMLLDRAAHFHGQFEQRRSQEVRANLELARSVATVFDAYIQDVLREEWTLGIALSTATRSSPEQSRRLLVAVAQEYPSIRLINWVNPRGQLIASSESEGIGSDFSNQPFFRDALASHKWTVGDVSEGPWGGGVTLAITRCICDGQGNVLGVVMAMVDPRRLDEVIGFERTGRADVSILDRRGQAVYPYPPGQSTPTGGRGSSVQPISTRALAGEEMTDIVEDQSGHRRIAGFAPIRSIGWIVVVSRPEEEVLGPVSDELLREGVQTFFAIAIAVSIALIVSRKITRPIRDMRAHALAIGMGEPSRQVKIDGPAEIKELGNAFNLMAREIEVRERELMELDKLKDEFIQVAAHELKTPVAIMKGYAQVLVRTSQGVSPQLEDSLMAINRGASRIDRIIGDLLDISRLHYGCWELTRESVDILQLARDVAASTITDTTAHRVRITGDAPVSVEGDRERLRQVLVNLVRNAMKYSPNGGDIDVQVAVCDEQALVSVRDRGVGIPGAKQRHIFERFYRAHNRTPHDYGGMGVGLYLSKEIVSRHGGRIWFESEEGRGSTFFFSIPTK